MKQWASMWAVGAIGLMAGLGSAEAVVVTVTAGPNAGEIVFNSDGYENEGAGTVSAPSEGSYTLVRSNPSFGSATAVTGPSAGGPPSAFSGSDYLALNRGSTGTTGLGSDFSRAINVATESFTLEYAFWGTTNSTAFGIGTSGITNVTVSTPGVLAGWRYNSGFNEYPSTGQTSQAGSLPYEIGEWNTFRYTWDHVLGEGTLTLNGQTVDALPRTSPPSTVQRFWASPGAASTTIYMDSVPEPATLGLLAIAGSLVCTRSRRGR